MTVDAERPATAPTTLTNGPSDSGLPTLERLLDAAGTLFRAKGFAATSTREIAGEVGIRQASLYHHVADKEELLYKICVTALDQFLSRIHTSNLASNAEPKRRIREIILTHVDALLIHQSWNVTMLMELRSLSREHRAQVVRLRESYAQSVVRALEQGQAEGLIRSDITAKYLSFALFDLLNWAALWFRPTRDIDPKQLAEVLANIYLQGATVAGTRLGERALHDTATAPASSTNAVAVGAKRR